MAIKAIIFDIDGVLLDSLESNIKFFQALMQKAGYKKPPRKIVKENFHLTMREMIRELTGNAHEKEIMRIWKMGKSSRYREFADIPCGNIPEDSIKVVKHLGEHYKLGLVTGRIKIGVSEMFKLTKNEKHFSVVVSFEDYKKAKPDPEPLMMACKKLNARPEEAIYIGDAETDMRAAEAAGMHFILFSSKKMGGAKYMTNSFCKIPEIVSRIDRKIIEIS